MKEIGGYIELDEYALPMLHDEAIKLNCGRNALAYLIQTKKIKTLLMPRFLCDSCTFVLKKYGVEVRYYSIDMNLKPVDISLKSNEWIYVVNYYGQLSNDYIRELKMSYNNIILDNAQAYFQMPVNSVDTLYTCRKFLGVSDGAILYTDDKLAKELQQDKSYDRMQFLLGRFENTASEFYLEYVHNNHIFINEPIKRMSKLTENLLHGIDYESVRRKRTQNFKILHNAFMKNNKLKLSVPAGAFMYPLYIENAEIIRKKLQQEKIYIPIYALYCRTYTIINRKSINCVF